MSNTPRQMTPGQMAQLVVKATHAIPSGLSWHEVEMLMDKDFSPTFRRQLCALFSQFKTQHPVGIRPWGDPLDSFRCRYSPIELVDSNGVTQKLFSRRGSYETPHAKALATAALDALSSTVTECDNVVVSTIELDGVLPLSAIPEYLHKRGCRPADARECAAFLSEFGDYYRPNDSRCRYTVPQAILIAPPNEKGLALVAYTEDEPGTNRCWEIIIMPLASPTVLMATHMRVLAAHL